MDLEQAARELENPVQEEAAPAPVEQAAPKTAQEKIEELEIALNGKPFRLPTNVEIPIKHNGQILKQPLSNILNHYRQGTHIEDKIKEYQALKAEVEQGRGDLNSFNALKTKYGQIQDWSEKNPTEWQRLWELFQKKDLVLSQQDSAQSPSLPPKVLEYISKLEAKINEHDQKWSQWDESNKEAKVQQEVSEINKEVEAFAKEFAEIDLNETNLDGVSLKGLIMQHGASKNIGSFRLAALDYLGPRVFEIVQNRGRTEATKAVKADKQQGIIARSSTPFGQSSSQDTAKMSKADRLAAAKAELATVLSR